MKSTLFLLLFLSVLTLTFCQTKVNGVNQMTIQNQVFSNNNCLQITNSQNILVANCTFVNCATAAITISGSTGVEIRGNLFNVSTVGISAATSTSVNIHNNNFTNVLSCIKFSQITAAAGMRATYNLIENGAGSINNNAISLQNCSGLTSDNFQIVGNYIKATDLTQTTTAISSILSQYIKIDQNIIINTGLEAIDIQGGLNIEAKNNTIYGTSKSKSPILITFNGVCSTMTIQSNLIQWYNSSGVEIPVQSDKNCTGITLSNVFTTTLTANIPIPTGVGVPVVPTVVTTHAPSTSTTAFNLTQQLLTSPQTFPVTLVISIVIPIGGVILLAGAAVGVFFLVRKVKKNKKPRPVPQVFNEWDVVSHISTPSSRMPSSREGPHPPSGRPPPSALQLTTSTSSLADVPLLAVKPTPPQGLPPPGTFQHGPKPPPGPPPLGASAYLPEGSTRVYD